MTKHPTGGSGRYKHRTITGTVASYLRTAAATTIKQISTTHIPIATTTTLAGLLTPHARRVVEFTLFQGLHIGSRFVGLAPTAAPSDSDGRPLLVETYSHH